MNFGLPSHILKIAATLLGLVVIVVAFFSYSSSSASKIKTYTVVQETLTEDILASGRVEGVTSASFSFKSPGKVTQVLVKAGDTVTVGQELVLQDTASLDSQIAEMDAGIAVQRARLTQLKAGSSLESIDVAESSVSSASTAYENAKTNLQVSRQGAVDAIIAAYTTADDAVHNKADKMFTNPRSKDPKLTTPSSADFTLSNDIERLRLSLESELTSWARDNDSLSVDSDLTLSMTSARKKVELVKQFLEKLSLFTNNDNNAPSSIPQSTWETRKVEIALAKASVTGSLSSLTQAQSVLTQTASQVTQAKSALSTVDKQLTQARAQARGTDVAVYQAQLNQAITAKRKVEALRSDLVITAPFAGIVTDVSVKVGEVAGPTKANVSLLSFDKLQVKVNIVENNIVQVKVGQQVKLTFDAMPSKTFTGKVIAIDPAEKEINGTIYYQTTVELASVIDFLRPGMTANVWTIIREIPDGIAVPASALYTVGDTTRVRVTRGGVLTEKIVTTGFADRQGRIQVTSGLHAGEVVLLEAPNGYEHK